MKNNDLFNHFLNGMEKDLQANLRYWLQRNELLDQLRNSQEREQLKKEITEDVMSRISVSIDTTEIFKQIDELKKAIETLGK